jgi:multiple sugar transport system substrate-binding protein
MNIKKLTAMGIAGVMAFSMAACGSGTSSSSETSAASSAGNVSTASSSGASDSGASAEKTTMTLALRGGTYASVIKQCLPEFEKENNCKIDVLELEFDDLHSKIALDAQNSKGAYDLVMVDGSWMAEFTENEVLANLSDEGYKFDDDIIPGTTEICKDQDGNIFLAPYFGNVTVMLYNKDLVKAAGYTGDGDISSWEDVMKIAQSAKASGKNGYIVRGGNPDSILSDFIPVMLAIGAWVVDDDNKPTVNTEEMKQALTQYKELAETGQTMEKDDIVAQIDNGDGALAVGWPGWYSPTDDSNGSYTVIPSTLTAGGKEENTSLYGTWCIGVPQNAPDKDLGVKLLEYLMDKDVQLSTVEAGGVPCRYSCLKDENVLKTHPTLSIVCDALEKGVYRPVISQWNDFTTTFGTEIDNYMQGTESLDDALKNAQTQLELLMQ